jgi:hypothetical protein
MSSDPVRRLAERLQELRREDAEALAKMTELGAKRREIAAEIARLDETAGVLRSLVPGGWLPHVDEDAPLPYGDLKSKTVPQGIVTILRQRGEPATTREILDILIKGEKVADKQSSHINILNVLKKNPKLFTRIGKTWGLAEWPERDPVASQNGHLPLEGRT